MTAVVPNPSIKIPALPLATLQHPVGGRRSTMPRLQYAKKNLAPPSTVQASPERNFSEPLYCSKDDPFLLEAPTSLFLENVLSSVALQNCPPHLRVIPIDAELLDILKRISPPFLGGTLDAAKAENEPILVAPLTTKDNRIVLGGTRPNTWTKTSRKFFSDAVLVSLFEAVKKIEQQGTAQWRVPSAHHNFHADGGWPVYILKLHQIVLACLAAEPPTSTDSSATTSPTTSPKLQPADAWKAKFLAVEGTSHTAVGCVGVEQSNLYETRTLWALACRAAEAVNVSFSLPSQRAWGNHESQELLHHESSTTTASLSPERVTPVGSGSETQHETPVKTTDEPKSAGVETTPKEETVGLKETDLQQDVNKAPPKRTPSASLVRGMEPLTAQPPEVNDKTPMKLVVVLVDGASDYVKSRAAAGGLTGANVIQALRQSPPIVAETHQPTTLSFVETDTKGRRAVICMDTDLLSFAIRASGRFDAYYWAHCVELLMMRIGKANWSVRIPGIFNASTKMIENRATHALRLFRESRTPLTAAKIEYLMHMLSSSSSSAADDALTDIKNFIWEAAFDRGESEGCKRLEGLLVALLGHSDDRLRSSASVLLNCFYDEHDWQADIPFVPSIKQVGDPFEVTICIEDAADPRQGQIPKGVFLILSAPSFDPASHYSVYSYHELEWMPSELIKGKLEGLGRYQPSIYGRKASPATRHRWVGTARFAEFPRCGFYDWRVVRINEDYGSWEAVQAALSELRRTTSSSTLLNLKISLNPEGDLDSTSVGSPSSAGGSDSMVVGKVYPHPQRMTEVLKSLLSLPGVSVDECRTFPLQGRFIVQPSGIADEQAHELFVDEHNCEFDSKTGRLLERGSFASITASLPALRAQGITLLYLVGALARDNGHMDFGKQGEVVFEREDASPFAVSSRCTPNVMHGGAMGLAKLMKEAHRVGIRIVCDSLTRVASSHMHRDYEKHVMYYVDESGKKSVLYGCPGRAASFEDTVQLNYRKVETWDLMVSELLTLAGQYGLDGVRLEDSQSAPLIFDADIEELRRCDPDGSPHYSVLQRMLGEVVVPEAPNSSAFWGNALNWANPFLVKITREIWKTHPQFVFIGETSFHDAKQSFIARSGFVPQIQDLCDSLARVFGQSIDPASGAISPTSPASVQELITWFDSAHSDLPEGAVMMLSSCSSISPLPALLYGKGAWPAADLLMFLPDIPCTLGKEMDGHCFRMDITNVFIAGETQTASPLASLSAGISPLQSSPSPGQRSAASALRRTQTYRPSTARPLVKLGGVGNAPFMPIEQAPKKRQLIQRVRSLQRFEPITQLAKLEEEQTQKLGPEFGFDLQKIHAHYLHRRRLRHHLKLFRTGILVPLSARHGDHCQQNVLAFLRFDPDNGEFVMICINFSGETFKEVTVSLKALAVQFRNMGLESNTVFISTDLYECGDQLDKTEAVGESEGATQTIPVAAGHQTLGGLIHEHRLYDGALSLAELLHKPHSVELKPYGSICRGFKPMNMNELSLGMIATLYSSSLARLQNVAKISVSYVVKNGPIPPSLEKSLRFNFVMETLMASVMDSGLNSFLSVLHNLKQTVATKPPGTEPWMSLHELLVDSGMFCPTQQFDCEAWRKLCCKEGGGATTVLAKRDDRAELAERLVAKMAAAVKCASTVDSRLRAPEARQQLQEIGDFAKQFVDQNNMGPIVFVTTELGKWSTVGGLGVMVDELSCTLAENLGQSVYVVSPYYHFDRKGQPAQMSVHDATYKSNISVTVGGEKIELGVHEGRVRGVNLIFLHNVRFFPQPYPSWNVPDSLRFLSVIGKAVLEVLCQKRLIPQLIITNDWPTGLVAAYGKNPTFFNDVFRSTTFFHIVHNLDANYEGRIYSDRTKNYNWITELSTDLLVDPTWGSYLYNPSRCALMCSDAWGTVSPSYRDDLRRPGGSALASLLNRYPMPFAYPNGVPLAPRLKALRSLKYKTHSEAKAELQRKYFGFEQYDPSIPLFAFIGRVTEQKGVHLIVDAAEQLIERYQCKIQILVGGRVTWSDPYSSYCGRRMFALRSQYPYSFWASPDEFFSDGTLVNIGADVALMPSKFEPGGIVQHEFFIAGTPVLAFRTGGLRDTVFEFDVETQTGNGFTFEGYELGDYLYAMDRAIRIFRDPVKYEKCRENARFSVVSCEQVAQAWLTEFCRLRRKLPVNYERVDEACTKFAESWDISTWHTTRERSPSFIPTPAEIQKINAAQRPGPEMKGALAAKTTKLQTTRSATTTAGASTSVGAVPVRVRFTPRTAIRPRLVAVSGSFDNWQIRRPMSWDNALQAFCLTLALKPGQYTYKLIVDGAWTLNPDAKSATDEAGNSNNILVAE